MAVFVATDYQITIGGVDLSDRLTSVELPIESDDVDTTAFGGAGWRSRTGGLKSGSITLNFNQDFAAGETDATLWPLFNTSTTVVVKPTTAAVSVTNPSYTGSFLVNSITPIAGSVGDLATQSLTWPLSGALTRTTA